MELSWQESSQKPKNQPHPAWEAMTKLSARRIESHEADIAYRTNTQQSATIQSMKIKKINLLSYIILFQHVLQLLY